MNTKRNLKWLVRVGLGAVCTLAVALFLLSWNKKTHAQGTPVHVTSDWSNRHLVYSAPSSMAQRWTLQAEPRYTQQLARRANPAAQ